MQQLIEFAGNHPALVSALLVIAMLLIATLFADRLRGIAHISPAEAVQRISHDDAVLLDVREKNEYVNGHILNSIHIPFGSLDKRADELAPLKDKPVIIACRSGHRSAAACGLLRKQGFTEVHNLKGGILAWQHAEYPLSKD